MILNLVLPMLVMVGMFQKRIDHGDRRLLKQSQRDVLDARYSIVKTVPKGLLLRKYLQTSSLPDEQSSTDSSTGSHVPVLSMELELVVAEAIDSNVDALESR